MRDRTRTSPPVLAWVAAARVGVGAAMLLAPVPFVGAGLLGLARASGKD